MRLLWVHSVCPYPATDGNRIRHLGLIEAIAPHHDITLVCPATETELARSEPLRRLCRLIAVPALVRPSGLWRDLTRRTHELVTRTPTCLVPAAISQLESAVRDVADDGPFDATFTSLYVAPAAFRARARRRVIDDHNVESLLYRRLWQHETAPGRRLARLLDWRLVRGFERRWLQNGDAITVCSAQDRSMLVDSIPGLAPIYVVPNGVTAVKPRTNGGRERSLIFVGGLGYEPNADAARFLLDQVAPRVRRIHPDVRTIIVGKDPPPDILRAAGPAVVVTGEVASTEPYLREAAVAVVPLRSGGGTRLKILEAVAAGVPVVATTVAMEGLGFEPQQEILVADDADGIAGLVSALLSDPNGGKAIAARAAGRAREAYQWASIAKTLVEALTSGT